MIYATRYQARKHATANDKVIKVEGGYMVMDYVTYYTWTKQK